MINDIKKDFEWFKNNPTKIYADTGATSLKPKCVINQVNNYYNYQSTNPHNNDSQFAYQAHHIMDECRENVANLISCSSNEIIFTSGATESLNLFAVAIEDEINEGDEIVLTMFEHASNLLPWFNLAEKKKAKVKYIENNGINITSEDFKKVLSPKTKIVSFTGTSNVLGNALPVKEIISSIKQYNDDIYVCLDAAQMIPHHQVNVKEFKPDFVAFSGHKMFGPTGIGVAFMKHGLMKKLKPLRYGGGMNGVIKEHDFTFMKDYEKFEGGTPNIAGIYGLNQAVLYLQSIGYKKIQEHENEIYTLLKQGLSNNENIIVYNWDAKSSVLAFNVKGVHSQDVANYLGRKGIIVRSGLSCAKLLDHVICQPGVVRASFYIYNDQEDIKKFITELNQITKEKILNELI